MISVEEFQREATAWLAANKDDAPADWGAIMPPEQADVGRAWQRRLYDNGFAGIHWPTEHGGRGLTPEHNGAWIHACAIAHVPPVLNMVGLVLAGGSIQLFGSDDQKTRHLEPTLRGDDVWCQLFSEPGAGSDLASLQTRAELDGDRYVLNGQKVWCSGGRCSDWGILMARTEPDVPKHKGISFFLLDMRLPGIEVRPLKQMNGDAEFDEVFFTDVEVPADALLGERGQGWHVGMATLTNERGHIGSAGLSLSRRLDRIAQLGASADDPVAEQEVMQLWTRGHAMLAMIRRQGPMASVASSLAKLGMTELMYDTAVLRTQSAGADGMLDSEISYGLTSAPGGRIAGGTSQVQRNIIGERLLGLPKEPKPT